MNENSEQKKNETKITTKRERSAMMHIEHVENEVVMKPNSDCLIRHKERKDIMKD